MILDDCPYDRDYPASYHTVIEKDLDNDRVGFLYYVDSIAGERNQVQRWCGEGSPYLESEGKYKHHTSPSNKKPSLDQMESRMLKPFQWGFYRSQGFAFPTRVFGF